jgi:hypothetical protein
VEGIAFHLATLHVVLATHQRMDVHMLQAARISTNISRGAARVVRDLRLHALNHCPFNLLKKLWHTDIFSSPIIIIFQLKGQKLTA